LHIKSRFMHDLASLTLENAIARHRNEAAHVIQNFRNLTDEQQRQVITFLRSL
jgi:microsomal dipeptidase-like Zn-dependent dipeptidase